MFPSRAHLQLWSPLARFLCCSYRTVGDARVRQAGRQEVGGERALGVCARANSRRMRRAGTHTKTNTEPGEEQRKGIVVEPGSIPTLIKFRPASRLAEPAPRAARSCACAVSPPHARCCRGVNLALPLPPHATRSLFRSFPRPSSLSAWSSLAHRRLTSLLVSV